MSVQMRNSMILVIVVVLVFGIGFGGGILLDRLVLIPSPQTTAIPPEASGNFGLMAEAWKTIRRFYVDQGAAEPQVLTYGSISGMMDSLGDTGHSRFLSPEMVRVERDLSQGEFEGIGAEVQAREGQVIIVAPMDNSPALQAGLRPGDVILAVDGQDVTGMPLDQVTGLIKGPAGTSVTLTILTPATDSLRDVEIERARIQVVDVTWQQLPGTRVAHVRIARFSSGVTDDLARALQEVEQAGLEGIILDLRSNPGGLLDEAVGVASQFVREGAVLQVRNATGEVTPVMTKTEHPVTDLLIVGLIDQGTASASEIVAGALQDAGRAEFVGETTFGTGTVLQSFPLSDGSALLLATQEWLTRDGRVIWHEGLDPDVVVSLPVDVFPLTPRDVAGLTSDELRASSDAQLLRALEMLEDALGRSTQRIDMAARQPSVLVSPQLP
ncbi:MAG: S41 family peptidase [Anaerolineae bacterium]